MAKRTIRQLWSHAHIRAQRAYGKWRMNIQGGFRSNGHVRSFLSPAEGNDVIRRRLKESEPFMTGRPGLYEFWATASTFLEYRRHSPDAIMHYLHLNAGFFPANPAMLEDFASVYRESITSMDCYAAWCFRHGMFVEEERAFATWCPTATLTDIRALNVFDFEHPWTEALDGKSVLVIHPLASTIETQYNKRDHLFGDWHILPSFKSLTTIPAIQSAGGNNVNFTTWFEALTYMYGCIDKIDFDIALIAAGAYGLPLAAYIRKKGKSAIHMGGILQLLFGIMGRRWEGKYGHLTNKYWTRPPIADRPPRYAQIEGGCYW